MSGWNKLLGQEALIFENRVKAAFLHNLPDKVGHDQFCQYWGEDAQGQEHHQTAFGEHDQGVRLTFDVQKVQGERQVGG